MKEAIVLLEIKKGIVNHLYGCTKKTNVQSFFARETPHTTANSLSDEAIKNCLLCHSSLMEGIKPLSSGNFCLHPLC